MVVSLYTSRVILQVLGVDDFGLNAVVTSAITIFFFLNSSMAGATSRFLTFELGRGDTDKLKKTFSAALTIHVVIALIILVLGETIGLWYLENKMVISEGRVTAARWVYHLSLISAMITITQVPYNASIMSHEKMNVYAYIDILHTCLKLGIIYLLLIGNADKLILYAALTLCITIAISIIYRVYCMRMFEECRYKFEYDREIFKPFISFVGWNLYSEAGLTASGQGTQLVLNLFFNNIINAAYSVGHTMSMALRQFANNFTIAATPQIIKYYASGEIKNMQRLVEDATKYAFLIFYMMCFPVMLEIDLILDIWLNNVPEYTHIFSRLNIVILLIGVWGFHNITTVIRATGKMKAVSLLQGTLRLLIPVMAYLLFRFADIPSYNVLNISIGITLVIFTGHLCIVKKLIPKFSVSSYLTKVILLDLYIIAIASVLPLFIRLYMDEGWQRLILVALSSVLCLGFATYFLGMNKITRQKIITTIRRGVK
jgi:O-antigen/teichoic acid export membrane protein